MDKMNFGTYYYGAINPALLMQHHRAQQQIEHHYASPHSSIATPMMTPLLDSSLTPYTPVSLSMEDFSQTFIEEEDMTPIMSAEQDMTVASYLFNSVTQDHHQVLHDHQGESLFPALAAQWSMNHNHTCHICHRSFTRKFNLLTHIRTHDKHREKPYPCASCTKRFDRKHDCKRHYQTVHQGLKTHPCHLCTCAFSRKDALSRHMDQKHPKTAM